MPGAIESPSPGAPPAPASPSTTPPTTPPAVRPPTPGTDGPTLTITGTVEAGVESGCLVLTVDGTTYELLGARDLVRVGDVVALDGVLARDVVTTCQQGAPFRVRAVRPA